jgi:excisionase family DNA binding protein
MRVGQTSNPVSNRLTKGNPMTTYATPQTISSGKRVLTIRDFSEHYRLSRSSIYKLNAAGKLPFVKVGKRSLIRVEDAEALISGVDAR